MKTVNYFLIIFLCLCLSACNSNDKPEIENTEIEDPVEVEEPVIEEPEIEEPVIEEPEIEEPEVENPKIEDPELEEPEIEDPCPDLDEVNPHFVYGDIPDLAARLAYMGMERPADSYNYPLYPGMEGYAELTNGGMDFRKFCQITPACLLSKMSTQAVIQAIWEMPTLGDYFIFSSNFYNYNGAIDSHIRGYNAFEELTKREDAGAALLERLTLVNPLTPMLRYESQFLELLLSHSVFFSQLNESEKRKTVEITLSNDDKRSVYEAKSRAGSLRSISWVLIGKTMLAAGYTPFIEAVNENDELKYFVEGWRPLPTDPSRKIDYTYTEYWYGNIPQLIIEYAKNFIND